MKIQPIRGTHDIYGMDLEKFNRNYLDCGNSVPLGTATWILIAIRLSYRGLSQ